MGFNSLPPFSARSQWNAVRPGLVRTWRAINNAGPSFSSASIGSGSQPITVHTSLMLQEAFDFIRVGYFNDQTNPWDLDQVIVASSASLTDPVRPVADAAGRGGLWVTAPFNGNGLPTDYSYERYQAGMDGVVTKGVTVPVPTRPTGYGYHHGFVVSDWTPLTSAALASGLPGAIPMIRSFANGSRGVATNVMRVMRIQPGTDFTSAWQQAANNRGRILMNWPSASDGVSSTANINAYSTAVTGAAQFEYLPLYFVQTISRSRAITLMGVGDSLTSGARSTGQFQSWGLIAAQSLARAKLPVEWVNTGQPGASSLIYHFNGAAEIALAKPEIVAIATFSPNDGTPCTSTTIDDGFRRAMNLAMLTQRHGGVPILWTPPPCAACSTVAADNLRKDLVARVKGLADAGFLIVDVDGIVSDGGSIAAIRSPYAFGDGTHFSDAGNAAVAAQGFVPAIRPLLA